MNPHEDFEAHRRAIYGHCYRMLGAPAEAEDAVQDTFVRAWRARAQFDGRAQLRTWLYRIATNVCLDALADRQRRERPMQVRRPGSTSDPLIAHPPERWVEPVPDALAIPAEIDPSEQLMLRQSIRLAFIAALQHLPPKQRAALLSTEVLGWTAKETADCLETSVASVNSALQRARAKLAQQGVVEGAPLTPTQATLVNRYVEAFERYDIDALTALMRQDTAMSMPPFDLWLEGPATIGAWLKGPGAACQGSRLVPTAANGSPAFAQYKPDETGYRPWALLVLETGPEHIASSTFFLDVDTLFPLFGLPKTLPR